MTHHARTPLTLIAGIGIGLLIGGYVHTANAGPAPCATPVVKPVPAIKGHPVLATYDGDNKTKPDEFGSYHATKKFTYRGPITITITGTQLDPKKNASGSAYVQADVTEATSIGGQVAIAPGDSRTQTISATISAADNQCKFGCVVGIIEPTNLRWHIVVTK